MSKTSIIKIELDSAKIHQAFEYNSNAFKKLVGVFCSPAVQLSLVFNNGRKVFVRGQEYQASKDTIPNHRVFRINKVLDNEIISGMISKAEANTRPISVYLILEK